MTSPPARPRTSVYIATSLDGFIAREDGSVDWLPAPDPGGEDFGYAAFAASVDAIVMGRASFESVLTFGDWPYRGQRVLVLSRTMTAYDPRVAGLPDVEVHPGPPATVLRDLHARGVQHVYVDGGRVVQAFLAHGLIDAFILTRIPVLLGGGRPLFGDLPKPVPLEHVETRAYPQGLVQSHYRVVREGA
jgi:dihydrofolate reductase